VSVVAVPRLPTVDGITVYPAAGGDVLRPRSTADQPTRRRLRGQAIRKRVTGLSPRRAAVEIRIVIDLKTGQSTGPHYSIALLAAADEVIE
jgi:hypothetical protein